jgi:hypothetical protein
MLCWKGRGKEEEMREEEGEKGEGSEEGRRKGMRRKRRRPTASSCWSSPRHWTAQDRWIHRLSLHRTGQPGLPLLGE